jgi:GDP-L-fucose synthase
MKKILVTGRTGTIGANLNFADGDESRSHDLRVFSEAQNLLSRFNPDAVVHCAAKVGGLKFHLDEKNKLFFDNTLINTNTIEACRRHGVKRVLSFLSSCIFSDESTPPYDESQIHEFKPAEVHYPYGFAKRSLEVHSRICYEQYGLKYNCVVPVNMFGPKDNFNFDTGHVIGVLIHRAYTAKLSGGDFAVWGNGKQERDFLFTEDVEKLTKWALESYLDKEPLILSADTPLSIGYVAEIIAKKFGILDKLKFDTSKPSGQVKRHLNGSKLRSLVHFKFTPIEEGVEKTIDWFLANYPNVRK